MEDTSATGQSPAGRPSVALGDFDDLALPNSRRDIGLFSRGPVVARTVVAQ
jgi:hypothetical protein